MQIQINIQKNSIFLDINFNLHVFFQIFIICKKFKKDLTDQSWTYESIKKIKIWPKFK